MCHKQNEHVQLLFLLLSQDATFEFERKRNRPERYDRNVVENTVKAMKKIEEIRLKREEKFWESR
jgi:large subunit ribosomal protein L24e